MAPVTHTRAPPPTQRSARRAQPRAVRVAPALAAALVAAAALLLHQATPAHALSDKVADARGVPSDLPYIRCEACSHVARAAAGQADGLSGAGVSENGLLDVVEALCDPGAEAGRWARRVDLVERVGRLRLVAQTGEQDCKRECRTLALACRAVLDGVETELAERLYALRKRNESTVAAAEDVTSWLCDKRKGASVACRKRAPFLPRDRPKGPPFEPKSEKDIEMEKLMAQMKAMNGGMGMDMMTRDDAMKKAAAGGFGGGGGADDDDDGDDGDSGSAAAAEGSGDVDGPPDGDEASDGGDGEEEAADKNDEL